MSKKLDQSIHILLPKQDLKLLKHHAKLQKASVGRLIRRAIREVYGTADPIKRQQSFQRLSQQSDLVMGDWDEVKREIMQRHV